MKPRYAKLAFACVCIAQVVWVGLGLSTLSLYANPITAEWGILRSQFMLTVTLAIVADTVVGSFFFGPLLDFIGTRWTILAGGACCTLGLLVIGLAANLAMLYVGGFVFGTGLALVNPNLVNVVVTRWFKTRNGTYAGIANMCGSVTSIASTAVLGVLVFAMGWRLSVFATVAVSAVFTALCTYLYKGDPSDLGVEPVGVDAPEGAVEAQVGSRPQALGAVAAPDGADAAGAAAGGEGADAPEASGSYRESYMTFGDMFRSPCFIPSLAIMFVIGMVAYAPITNLALIAADAGFLQFSGALVSVAFVASTATLIAGGVFLDRFGSARYLLVSMLVGAAGFAILRFGPSGLPALVAAALLLGISYNQAFITTPVFTREVFGLYDSARKMALLYGVLNAGSALGALFMTLSFDATGSYDVIFAVYAACAVAAGLLAFPCTNGRLAARGGRRREASRRLAKVR